MKTALISTLGFDEKFCYRAILRHGIKEGDVVVLFTAEMVDRVVKAYEWIQRLLKTSYGDGVKVEIVQLDIADVVGSVKKVIEKIKEISEDGEVEVIVNLSGGMRALIVIVLLACILNQPRRLKIEMEREDFSGIIELPTALLKLIKSSPREDKLQVLEAVRSGMRDVRSISRTVGRDESTVRRHLSALEEMGLVVVEKRKPLIVKATKLADVITETHKPQNHKNSL